MRFVICLIVSASLLFLIPGSNCHAQVIKDWKKYEEQIRFRVSQSVTSASRISQFGLTDEQVSRIRDLKAEHERSESQLRARQRTERQKGNLLWREGQVDEAKKIFDRLGNEKLSLQIEFTKRVESVLLFHQAKLIRQIAKRSAAIRKANTGDFFGIPLALADEIGIPKSEVSKFETKVREERTKYHTGLEDLRRKAAKKVLESLPAEKRMLFKQKFGEIYDSKAEEIRVWDDYRK